MDNTSKKTVVVGFAAGRQSRAAHFGVPSVSAEPAAPWGAVSIDAEAFDELESCMTNPAKPTQSIQAAANLLRKLYNR